MKPSVYDTCDSCPTVKSIEGPVKFGLQYDYHTVGQLETEVV